MNRSSQKIEMNDQFKRALHLMEDSNRHLLITGKAGTGKSTLLKYFICHTEKTIVVLAPTGAAALNVGGQTIHSFFQFKPDITIDKVQRLKEKEARRLYKEIDTILIDEVSMLRADILDCIDRFLRLNSNRQKPFGGKQMIFFGDLYQLPPIVTTKEKEMFNTKYDSAYFFAANAIQSIDLEIIELEHIYRQTDQNFIDILNAIRNNTVENVHLEHLNRRYDPHFIPSKDDFYVTLTTRNDKANQINQQELKKLPSPAVVFSANIQGDFDSTSFPTEEQLVLKVGAKVMMLTNEATRKWVNGTMGMISAIDEDKQTITVSLENGNKVNVHPNKWELFRYIFDSTRERLTTKRIGSFEQFPVRLAWAITIHKSQGKSYNKVIVDIGRGTFSPGQMYVALSRVTSLQGLVLKNRIQKKHIFMDWKVVKFMTQHQYRLSEKNMPLNKKIELIRRVIERKGKLEITYLKPSDQKSKRVIIPHYIGEMFFKGKPFLGLEAYCLKRNDNRNFRIDRILEMREID